MWRVKSVPGARWRVPRVCWLVFGMCWHVGGLPELPPVRGGSGEAVLRAVLQIGGRGTLWWCPLLDSMFGGVGFETAGMAARGASCRSFDQCVAVRATSDDDDFLGFDRLGDDLLNGSPHSYPNSLYRFPQTAPIVTSKNSGKQRDTYGTSLTTSLDTMGARLSGLIRRDTSLRERKHDNKHNI
uniref:Uncharacterized protein n=1 Tax=Fagus sylvatica TaxID=28930 RepID=A0A2N9EYX5_FAGSY